MKDYGHVDAIVRAVQTTTGHVPQVLGDEVDEDGQHLLVLGMPTGVKFGVTITPAGFRKKRLSLGVQRGMKPVDTVYDETLEERQFERMLNDPMLIVGILVGQRSGKIYTLD